MSKFAAQVPNAGGSFGWPVPSNSTLEARVTLGMACPRFAKLSMALAHVFTWRGGRILPCWAGGLRRGRLPQWLQQHFRYAPPAANRAIPITHTNTITLSHYLLNGAWGRCFAPVSTALYSNGALPHGIQQHHRQLSQLRPLRPRHLCEFRPCMAALVLPPCARSCGLGLTCDLAAGGHTQRARLLLLPSRHDHRL